MWKRWDAVGGNLTRLQWYKDHLSVVSWLSDLGLFHFRSCGGESAIFFHSAPLRVSIGIALMQVTGCHLHECHLALHWVLRQGAHPSTIPDMWNIGNIWQQESPISSLQTHNRRCKLWLTTIDTMKKIYQIRLSLVNPCYVRIHKRVLNNALMLSIFLYIYRCRLQPSSRYARSLVSSWRRWGNGGKQ